MSDTERDPWKHRSEGMRCSTCMYFVPKEGETYSAPGSPTELQIGRCRRHAPTIVGFPVVFPTDWCGDHKLVGRPPHPMLTEKPGTVVYDR